MIHVPLRCVALLTFVVLLGLPPARAGELAGVKMDDTLALGDRQLVLNGLSVRTATFLKVKVYVIGLYLEVRSQDPRAIIESRQRKRVVMHFVHDVGAHDLRKGWRDGFEKNARDLDAVRSRLAALEAAMRNVEKGERLRIDFVGEDVEIRFGDQWVATIEGNDFQQALLGCWLGPKPLTQELKAGMLGKS